LGDDGMKAAVLEAIHQLRLRDAYPMPQITGSEVLIRVEVCGLCATDIKLYKGEYTARLPVITGHEFTGVIENIGGDVKNIRPGDRVVVDPNESCCVCTDCKTARSTFCKDMAAYGVFTDGGFAQYAKADERGVYKIPDSLPAEAACFAEPVSCAVHGIDRARIKAGDTVAVLGAGTMGQLIIQLAANSGAARVISIDPLGWKLELSKAHGATDTVDAAKSEPAAKVAEITGGRGADVVFEAVGSVQAFETALSLAARGGTVVQFGFAPEGARAQIVPFDLLSKELTLAGSWLNPYTFDRAIKALASGMVKTDRLITNRLPLSGLEQGIFKAMERPDGFMKAVIFPWMEEHSAGIQAGQSAGKQPRVRPPLR